VFERRVLLSSQLRRALAKHLRISAEFGGKLYDGLSPSATIIVAAESAVRKASPDFTILAGEPRL
jgi:hypothetical protein